MTPTGASGPVRRDACSMVEGPSPLPHLHDEPARTTDPARAAPDTARVHGVERPVDGWERQAMSARKLLAGLVDELPAPERVEPLAFIEDEILPRAMAPVEPAAFGITCVQAAWGFHGLRN